MKTFFTPLLIIVLIIISFKEIYPQDFQWVQKLGKCYPFAVTTDLYGNSYVTGRFSDTASFGNFQLYSLGDRDAFLAKYDNSGNCLWVKQAGGLDYQSGYSIALDTNNNIYVTGYFRGSISFGNIQFTTFANGDMFIAKYDNMGNLYWAKKAGGTDITDGLGISIDPYGNSYVVGEFGGTATFGITQITSYGDRDIFLAKYDNSGNCLWVKHAGGIYYDRANCVSTDTNGYLYLSGFFQDSATFGTKQLTSYGSVDIFIAKYDNSGNLIWVKKAGGSNSDVGQGIYTDVNGVSYVTGSFMGIADFFPQQISAYGSQDAFIAKYDSAGNCIWVNKAGGTGGVSSYSISVDNKDNSYITGEFSHTISFGSIQLTSYGYDDIFIAKYDNLGNCLWSKQAGGNNSFGDIGRGISVAGNGNCYITGYCYSTAAFGNLTLIGGSGYVTKILQNDLIVITPNGGDNYKVGVQKSIQWSYFGISDVQLEYTTNNGSSWDVIVSSIPASVGSYSWEVPNTPSTQCKIRISSASNSTIKDESDNVFTICNINLTSPNASENWQAGTQKTITWNSQNIANINIEYSTNNGLNWSAIVSDIPSNTGQYLWTVQNTPSNQCKVRIVSSQYPDIRDMSDGLFTISHIKVTAPNGGEVWQGGSPKSIVWESSFVSNVKIEYSTNNGTDWTSIISSTPASAGQYLWTVPNASSSQCKLRISDVTSTEITDISDGLFTISPIPLSAIITADSVWLDSDFDGLVIKQVNANQSVGSITLYEWFVNGVAVAQGVSPTIELRTGENILKLKVTDSHSQTAHDSMKIKVYCSKYTTNGGIFSGVSQVGNTFYATSMDRGVYRFDSTGVLSTPYMTGGSIQSTLAISTKNLLYTGSDDTRLYCFDLSLNSIWDKSMGGVIKASPSISSDGNTIYIGTNNGFLKALDANNGNPRWTFDVSSGIVSSPTIIELVDSSQTVIEKIIYFGAENGTFYAIKDKGTSYEMFWSISTVPDSGIISSPAISNDGMIYFGSKNGYLHRVLWDGTYQTTWKKYTGGKIVSSPLIGKNDLVFVASESGFLYGYEKEFTFEAVPKKQFQHQWGVNGTPSIGKDGNLYIGCNNGMFYKLEDVSGNVDLGVKWYLTTNSGIESPVLASESGLVVVGCTNGDIYIMKDLSANTEGTENLNLSWPTFKGNNKRNKVTQIYTATTGVSDISEVPESFKLSQNYPNPFNPSTVINYQIPVNTYVTLKVFDVIGNEVATLVNEVKAAGFHSVIFNAENISTGIYFYQLQTSEFVGTKKLILMK